MIDTVKMWRTAMMEIQTEITQANFSTWFKDTEILRIEDGVVYLGVPNSFTQEWIEKKFHRFILRTLKHTDSSVRELEYVIVKEKGRELSVSHLERCDDMVREIKGFIVEEIEKMKTEIIFAINRQHRKEAI